MTTKDGSKGRGYKGGGDRRNGRLQKEDLPHNCRAARKGGEEEAVMAGRGGKVEMGWQRSRSWRKPEKLKSTEAIFSTHCLQITVIDSLQWRNPAT